MFCVLYIRYSWKICTVYAPVFCSIPLCLSMVKPVILMQRYKMPLAYYWWESKSCFDRYILDVHQAVNNPVICVSVTCLLWKPLKIYYYYSQCQGMFDIYISFVFVPLDVLLFKPLKSKDYQTNAFSSCKYVMMTVLLDKLFSFYLR